MKAHWQSLRMDDTKAMEFGSHLRTGSGRFDADKYEMEPEEGAVVYH